MVIPENYKNIFYFQKKFTIFELQNLSEIFYVYKNTNDIISLLKNRKIEIEEKNDKIILKFNAFMPDGHNKLIELNLIKKRKDLNDIIKYFFEQIKTFKNDIRKCE